MNHSFIPEPSTGQTSILETCSRCTQKRRRFLDSGTLFYQQLDGSWNYRRPGPCSREHHRALLAAEINKRVRFMEVEKR